MTTFSFTQYSNSLAFYGLISANTQFALSVCHMPFEKFWAIRNSWLIIGNPTSFTLYSWLHNVTAFSSSYYIVAIQEGQEGDYSVIVNKMDCEVWKTNLDMLASSS